MHGGLTFLRRLLLIVILLSAIAFALPVYAQTRPDTPDTSAPARLERMQKDYQDKDADSVQQKCVCLLPGPRERCRMYWLAETGFMWRISGDPFPSDNPRNNDESGFFAVASFGFMGNLDSHHALGGALEGGVTSDILRLAIKPRFRRWWSENWYADIALGPIIAAGSSLTEVDPPGFSAHAALGLHRAFYIRIGLEIIERYEVISWDWSRGEEWTDTSVYAGGTFAGPTGIGVALMGGLLVLVVALSYASG